MTQVKLCEALVSGGFNTPEYDPEGKKEQMMEISFMKKELNVFYRGMIRKVHFRAMV